MTCIPCLPAPVTAGAADAMGVAVGPESTLDGWECRQENGLEKITLGSLVSGNAAKRLRDDVK